MTIGENKVSTPDEKIPITVTSGDSVEIKMHIPDGCNNEAVCYYEGTECGHCRLNTTCTFEVINVEAGKTVSMTVVPCQGVEHSYTIELSGKLFVCLVIQYVQNCLPRYGYLLYYGYYTPE